MRAGGLALIAVAWLTTSALAGPCASRGTIGGKLLGNRGGMVIGAEAIGDDDPLAQADAMPAPSSTSWYIEVNGSAQPARPVKLGPNLIAIAMPDGAEEAMVKNGSYSHPIRSSTAKPLGAPKVSRVAEKQSGYGRGTNSVIATVGAIPEGAVALLAYSIQDGGEQPVAGWIEVTSGKGRTLTLSGPHSRCSAWVAGISASPGDKLKFAWVDRGGRLSKLSGTLTVGKTK